MGGASTTAAPGAAPWCPRLGTTWTWRASGGSAPPPASTTTASTSCKHCNNNNNNNFQQPSYQDMYNITCYVKLYTHLSPLILNFLKTPQQLASSISRHMKIVQR